MTTDDHHERPGLRDTGTRYLHDGVPLRWSAAIYRRHAGKTLDGPRPVLLDRAWAYEPASCMTGVRVVALRVGNGVFVCPLCGLRTR
ncbi:hypothetical protein [Pseudonocardia adelaidensis]|uniref:Uncharacterized protein n=1 Tax=Pseudonocardia adelaidensis TaxID=648754 RepID=A0ABP9NXI0_9PSEU